jgi:peptide chain release factor 2
MLDADPDPELSAELAAEVETIEAELDTFELKSLLQGPDDARDAQVEISAGAGGTEAQDWASMLMRMYTRWAERRGFELEILDLSEGEEAGIKGAVLEIRGQYAFGFLRPRPACTGSCASRRSTRRRAATPASRRSSSIPW